MALLAQAAGMKAAPGMGALRVELLVPRGTVGTPARGGPGAVAAAGKGEEEQQADAGPRGARSTEEQRSRPMLGFCRGEKEERGWGKNSARPKIGTTGQWSS